MRKSTKFFGALAVAGLLAAGGSAFTGTGVTNNAGATKFIGGTVTQSVSGATLSTIGYTFSDATNRPSIRALIPTACNEPSSPARSLTLADIAL